MAINLLPYKRKEQIEHSKRNQANLKILLIVVLVGATVNILMLTGKYYANQELTKAKDRLASIEKENKKLSKIEEDVEAIDTKLTAIEQLFSNSTRFSKLLEDIARVLPRGTKIVSLTLTGDDSLPLKLTASADSQVKAAVLQKALLKSDRFTDADIQSIKQKENEDGQEINEFTVEIFLAYAPGGAR